MVVADSDWSAQRFVSAAAEGRRLHTQLDPDAPSWLLNYLPIRILPNRLAVAKLVVITSTNFDSDPTGRCARQQPLRNNHVSTDPMAVLTIVDIRETLEARRQPLSHGSLAHKALAPRIWPTRQVQRTIVRKELHDRVQIVGIEGIEDRLYGFYGHRLLLRHGASSLNEGLTLRISSAVQPRPLNALVRPAAQALQDVVVRQEILNTHGRDLARSLNRSADPPGAGALGGS